MSAQIIKNWFLSRIRELENFQFSTNYALCIMNYALLLALVSSILGTAITTAIAWFRVAASLVLVTTFGAINAIILTGSTLVVVGYSTIVG
jgi:hypothetical protein